MVIKRLELSNNTVLGPLTDFNDHAFLILCRKYQAGLIFTQKYNIVSLKNNIKKFQNELEIYSEEHPIFIQLIGNDPKILSEVINMLESYNYDGYDLNLGCPSSDSKRYGIGGTLLKHPEKIRPLIKKMRNATNKIISAKIRIGYDNYLINALEIAKIIESEGAELLTIHGRTVKADYSGKNNLDMIKYVKENVSIPVIGNGDIIDGSSAKRMKNYTKCDLLMIGRAAIGNPYIFLEINEYLKDRKIQKLSKKKYKQILREYFQLLKKIYLKQGKKLTFFKKKMIQFIRPNLFYSNFKTKIFKRESITALENLFL